MEKKQIKLYTEDQVIKLTKAAYAAGENHNKFIFRMELNNLTPIELPTDEEIKEEVSKLKFSKEGYRGGVIEGMMWMRDKIKGGGDE